MKQIKKLFLLILLIIFSGILTACNYQHELKYLDVLTAVGIDKNDSSYEVCAQVLKADQAVNDSYNESYRYFFGTGEDFVGAVDDIYNQGSGELTFAHNKLYLWSYNSLVDIDEIQADMINTVYDIRPQSYCVIVKNDMKYFMTSADEYGYDCCYKLLEILKQTENVPRVNDVLLALNSDDKTVLVPVVEVIKGEVKISKWAAVDSYGINYSAAEL